MTALHPSKKSPPSAQNAWFESIKIVGLGLLLAFGVRQFVAEVIEIPSESMTPTLQIGDHLIVEKISYGFHLPQRGDVVVFSPTKELESQNIHDNLIKRVIGLPGDTVAVKNGRTFVNGQEIAEPYLQSIAHYNYGPAQVPAQSYFVLGDNRNQSYDSHLWGFVPQQNIVGHALFRFAPLTRMGALH